VYFNPPFYNSDYTFPRLEDFFYPTREMRYYEDIKKPEGKDDNKGDKKDGKKDETKVDKKDEKKKEEKKDEKPKVQIFELRVKLCCDNCVNKVKKKIEKMDGIEKVDCCQWTQKVTVKGTVKPEVVLKKVKKVDPGAELWNKK